MAHLTESRLRMFELVDFREDGSWVPLPLRTTPWSWWFEEGDVSKSSLEVLRARFGVTFE